LIWTTSLLPLSTPSLLLPALIPFMCTLDYIHFSSFAVQPRKGRLCWEVRRVEWITGEQRAPLCIEFTTIFGS
jgi:hypothetical protein